MNVRSVRGFSLVELMVSVAIVGTLAAMAVPNYDKLMNKAKLGRAKADMAGIRTSAMSLRASEDATLIQAMNEFYTASTMGAQWNQTPVCPSLAQGQPSYVKLGFAEVPTDPWGQCYPLDQNESESPGDCRYDAIWTAGPNQRWSGPGDGDDVFDDDLVMRIPFYQEHPNCPQQSLEAQFGG